MLITTTLLQLLYTIGILGLSLYGLNALWLTWISKPDQAKPYFTPQSPKTPCTESSLEGCTDAALPAVTVQLPVYNELHVIERLIDACATLDYPTDKLQIQILDDSTDRTAAVIDRRVDHWIQQGSHMEVIRREDRSGYKGGALAASMPTATGEFIALFDADFKPPSNFLTQLIPIIMARPQAGFIQARWTHLNTGYSPLTRSQALALDGHFMIEQVARQNGDYAFGFNGSAGIWRRSCIADPAVGGWQIDTLTEDLDLSYRAQLAGWEPLFVPEVEAPAEIPPQLLAFKRQQARWAKGSIQTLRKVGRRVWQSDWRVIKRVEALLHLGAYTLHPMLLLVLMTVLPSLLLGVEPPWVLTYLTIASVGPPILYAVAQYRLNSSQWWRRWSYIWLLTLLGFGLSLSNSVAVWEAISRRDGPFLRTPKFHIQKTTDTWHNSSYRLPVGPLFWGELSCLIYSSVTVAVAIAQGQIWTALFMLLYVGGFGLMIGIEVWQLLTSRIQSMRQRVQSPLYASPTKASPQAAKRDRIGTNQI